MPIRVVVHAEDVLVGEVGRQFVEGTGLKDTIRSQFQNLNTKIKAQQKFSKKINKKLKLKFNKNSKKFPKKNSKKNKKKIQRKFRKN